MADIKEILRKYEVRKLSAIDCCSLLKYKIMGAKYSCTYREI